MNPLLIAGAVGALYLATRKPSPPTGSPPTEFTTLKSVKPLFNTATAVSGRRYNMWTWNAPDGSGAYAVVETRNAGKSVWMSFTSNTSGTRTPVKTNVSEVVTDATAAQALLTLMRSDWKL